MKGEFVIGPDSTTELRDHSAAATCIGPSQTWLPILNEVRHEYQASNVRLPGDNRQGPTEWFSTAGLWLRRDSQFI